MDIKALITNRTVHQLILVSSIFPFNLMANTFPQAVSMSGELLQNNPMLNIPQAPHSEGLYEKKDNSAEKRQQDNETKKTGPELQVNHIIVVDSPQSAENNIHNFVEKFNGKSMTINELRTVAMEITSLLQRHGERLSYAYIPNQKITNGNVIINIMTGYLEAINVKTNESLIKKKFIDHYLNKIHQSESGITNIENQLLIISDLPGVGEISPYLSAGNETGGSILNLDLSPSPRVEGIAVFDNTGSLSTGRNRLGTQVNINSPFGFGDRLQALAYLSPDVLQINDDSKHGNTFISRVSYDAPINTNRTRFGASFSRVNYKLGGPMLYGLGDGFAEIASIYSSLSLIRSNTSNMMLGLNLDLKRMNDTFWGESNRRSSTVVSAQLSGNIPKLLWGKPNVIRYQLSYTTGRLNNDDSWNGLNTKGNFHKINQSIQFQQGLRPGLAFNVMFNGQQTSKNLDGAEKMPLGGPYAVRAYSNSSASADSAWIVSPGFSFMIPGLDGLSAELFYDYASGKVQKFSRRPSRVKLRGYGVGLNYDITSRLFVNTSYAWRDGSDKLLQSQNKAMGWVTAGYRF